MQGKSFNYCVQVADGDFKIMWMLLPPTAGNDTIVMRMGVSTIAEPENWVSVGLPVVRHRCIILSTRMQTFAVLSKLPHGAFHHRLKLP